MSDSDSRFETTHWSLVGALRNDDSGIADAALQTLCQKYWYPMFAFLRRKGLSESDAEDSVQEFLGSLIDSNRLQTADPNRGRFRSFLLTSLENHQRNARAKTRTLRRGGRLRKFSLDHPSPRGPLSQSLVENSDPAAEFDRQWALTILNSAFLVVEAEYRRMDQARLFDLLSPFISIDAERLSHEEIVARTGLSIAAVKSSLHRLRKRYRKAIEAEIAETVSAKDEVAGELGELLSALRG